MDCSYKVVDVEFVGGILPIGTAGDVQGKDLRQFFGDEVELDQEFLKCLAINVSVVVQLRIGNICSGDIDGSIKLWNSTTGVCNMTLSGHSRCINAIVIIDDIRICSSSADKTVRVWNTSTGVCERTLEGHTSYIYDMVLLLDGRICSISKDGSAKIWSVDTGVCDLTVQVCTRDLSNIIQLHDGRLVVSNYLRDV